MVNYSHYSLMCVKYENLHKIYTKVNLNLL